MIIVGGNRRKLRTVYAFEIEDGTFGLSPFPDIKNSRRPIARYDSKEELEAYVASRGCEVQWLET